MVACVKTVFCAGVWAQALEVRLSRVLPDGCVNCSKTYLPFGGCFYPKRLASAASPYRPRMAGNRTPTPSSADTTLCPLSYMVPLAWHSKSYSHIRTAGCCSQMSPAFRCQLGQSQSSAVRKESLLQGATKWGHGKSVGL